MSILQDLIKIVLMSARSVCDDIMYYVHASAVHFQQMGINVNLSFHPI